VRDRLGALAEHPEQRRRSDAVVGRHVGPERLVGAVLAPRLGQRLELDVGRVAARCREVGLDGEQLLGVERELAVGADRHQFVERASGQWHDLGLAGAAAVGVQHRLDRADRPPLDHRVGDDPAHDHLGTRGVDGGAELDASAGGGPGDRDAELGGAVHDRRGGGVGDAGEVGDLDPGSGGQLPPRCLEQRVAEETVECVEVGGGQVSLDEDDVAHGEPVAVGRPQVQVGSGVGERGTPRIGFDGPDRQSVPAGC
jgi:hypothetical protein